MSGPGSSSTMAKTKSNCQPHTPGSSSRNMIYDICVYLRSTCWLASHVVHTAIVLSPAIAEHLSWTAGDTSAEQPRMDPHCFKGEDGTDAMHLPLRAQWPRTLQSCRSQSVLSPWRHCLAPDLPALVTAPGGSKKEGQVLKGGIVYLCRPKIKTHR